MGRISGVLAVGLMFLLVNCGTDGSFIEEGAPVVEQQSLEPNASALIPKDDALLITCRLRCGGTITSGKVRCCYYEGTACTGGHRVSGSDCESKSSAWRGYCGPVATGSLCYIR